jgi:hypothetical protein
MRSTFAIAFVAAVAGLAGCTTPYSQLFGTRYHVTPIDTYPVSVVSVDGTQDLRRPVVGESVTAYGTQRPVLVEPGTRRITVQGPPTSAMSSGPAKTITLEVKPCTRYYLVAQKKNRLASDFDIVVDYEEPVPGCSRTG